MQWTKKRIDAKNRSRNSRGQDIAGCGDEGNGGAGHRTLRGWRSAKLGGYIKGNGIRCRGKEDRKTNGGKNASEKKQKGVS